MQTAKSLLICHKTTGFPYMGSLVIIINIFHISFLGFFTLSQKCDSLQSVLIQMED